MTAVTQTGPTGTTAVKAAAFFCDALGRFQSIYRQDYDTSVPAWKQATTDTYDEKACLDQGERERKGRIGFSASFPQTRQSSFGALGTSSKPERRPRPDMRRPWTAFSRCCTIT